MTLNATTDAAAARLLLERLVQAFTQHHEDLKVRFQEHAGGTLFTIDCHGAEGPRICGKKGKTIRSLQTLFAEIGRRNRTIYAVRLQDPEFGDWEERTVDQRRGPFNHTKAMNFLEETLTAAFGTTGWALTAVAGPSQTGFFLTDVSLANARLLTQVHEFTGMSVLDAMQALWKAYGREEGWKFTVEIR